MTPLFIATEKFDSSDGQKWGNYVEWARIPDLVELFSLDRMLCPPILRNLEDEDWKHNVHEDYRLSYFYHLDDLIERVAGVTRRNILGLYRNPNSHIDAAPAPGAFAFIGYDLIEEQTQVSALTNCGGFPETFSTDELNQYGLIAEFARACEIRRLLPERNPAEPHARCEMYAIWRLAEG
ncbi:MAG: hypothetical protein JWN51_2561 [Phycisphaerales bacterium]|nr:hypothetical protein [Phycisphaerales bacterium]